MSRAIHFAPTILPQDISISSNWHGIYERGWMKNIILLISLICKCEKNTFLWSTYESQTILNFFGKTFCMSKSNFLLYHLLYAFNINSAHFKICLMVVGLTFVIYQMTPTVH